MIYILLQLGQNPVIVEEVIGLDFESAFELLDDLNELLEYSRTKEIDYLTVISKHMFKNFDLGSWRVVAMRGDEEIFRMDFQRAHPSVVEVSVTRISRFEREDVI
jgi:hypothetical protein